MISSATPRGTQVASGLKAMECAPGAIKRIRANAAPASSWATSIHARS